MGDREARGNFVVLGVLLLRLRLGDGDREYVAERLLRDRECDLDRFRRRDGDREYERERPLCRLGEREYVLDRDDPPDDERDRDEELRERESLV